MLGYLGTTLIILNLMVVAFPWSLLFLMDQFQCPCNAPQNPKIYQSEHQKHISLDLFSNCIDEYGQIQLPNPLHVIFGLHFLQRDHLHNIQLYHVIDRRKCESLLFDKLPLHSWGQRAWLDSSRHPWVFWMPCASHLQGPFGSDCIRSSRPWKRKLHKLRYCWSDLHRW